MSFIRRIFHKSNYGDGAAASPNKHKEEEWLNVFQEVRPLIATKGKRSRDSPVPAPRSGHRIWTDGDYLYTVGGYNPDLNVGHEDESRALLREVWRLNLLTDVWQKVNTTGPFPEQVASFALASDSEGTRLFLFGGTAIPFGNTASKDMHVLYLTGKRKWQWEKLECDGTPPIAGYGQAMKLVDGKHIYVLGGTTGFEYNMLVNRLTLPSPFQAPALPTWESQLKGPECVARYRHEAVQMDRLIYVIGGGTRDNVIPLKLLDAFDLETRMWRTQIGTIPDPEHGYPTGRRCHAVVQYEHQAIVFGGFCGQQVNNQENVDQLADVQILKDVWSLDLKKLEWRKLPTTLPDGVYFHSATVTPDGCVYSFGGVLDKMGKYRSNSVLRMWLRPPSLQYSAARRLLRTFPSLASKSMSELRSMGVPQQLVQLLKNPDLAA